MRRTFVKSTILSIALMGLVGGTARAQWVAFNDHGPGTVPAQTAANATIFDLRNAGGPFTLKDITTGIDIPSVQMTVTTAGGTPNNGGTANSPNSGTPLYNTFNGYCFFGTNVIQVTAAELNTITFSGLDPNKRYKFMGGSVRGDSARNDRWTKCDITGAVNVTPNHQQSSTSPYGIITSVNEPTLMTGTQVAYNSGINTAGDMIEWDDIDPGSDGTFSVTSTQWQYNNAVTSHGTTAGTFTPNSANYGYAIDGFRLEEALPPNQPVTITANPTNQIIVVGNPVTFSVGVAGTPPFIYQWRKNSAAISGATNQTYTISNVVAGSGGSGGTYSVLVTNAFGNAASLNATLTVTNGFPIVITNQPQSLTIAQGTTANFSVGVSGTAPCYQWYKNGAIINNATNSSYMITNVATTDQATYTVKITNNSPSSVISSGAVLTVLTGPQALFIARTNLSPADIAVSNIIASQSLVVVVQDDRTAAFTQAAGKVLIVISSSIEPGNVAQKFNAATAPIVCYESGNYGSMYFTTTGATNAGIVTNQMGLNIIDPSQALAAGLSGITKVYASANQNFSFGQPSGNAFVVATSTNGMDLPVIFGYEKGAMNSLNLGFTMASRRVGLFLGDNQTNSLTTAGTNLFKAAVTWVMGTPDTTSPIGISRQPQSISVMEDSFASFSVNATGAPPYYYQWQRNGTNIPSATTRSYRLGPVTPADNGSTFAVIVTNRLGAGTRIVSSTATLTVRPPDPIIITNQPKNMAVYLGGPASFTVGVSGTAPRYQWFKDGFVIPNATNATYSIASVDPTNAGVFYVVVTNRTTVQTSDNAYLVVLPPAVQIYSYTNLWRYNTNGVDLATAGWKTNGYIDTAWAQGPGVFSSPTNEAMVGGFTISTPLPIPASNWLQTIYFRTHFQFTNDPVGVSIVFSNVIDDGAVFYLNGQEVARFAMPTSGPITYATMATRSDDISAHGVDSFTLSSYLLNQGDNVLAVEVHQGSSGSSDIAFGNTITLVNVMPTELAITNQPQDITVEEVKSATFTVGVLGSAGRYQWFHNGAPIAGASKDFLTIPVASIADAGSYYVIVSNVYSTVQSRIATLTVLEDTNKPTILGADGSHAWTNIFISFSEIVGDTTATNKANYVVTNVTSGGKLTINKATLVDGTNVVLATSPRSANANYVLIVNSVRDISPHQNIIATNTLVAISTRLNLINFLGDWWVYYPYVRYLGDPDAQEECIGTDWLLPEYVISIDNPPYTNWFWGNNLGIPGAVYVGYSDLPVPLGMRVSQSYAVIAYFRSYLFDFNGSKWGCKLKLQHLVDDGAVFYLNGQEIYRYNMPTSAVSCTTMASSQVTAPLISSEIELPADLLHYGPSNILAVSLHSAGHTERDLAFAAQLQASILSLVGGPVIVTLNPQDQTIMEGQPVTFNSGGVGATTVQWFQGQTAIPGATNTTYTIPAVTMGDNGATFYLRASNGSNTVNSTTARLTVVQDTNPPIFLSAVATAPNQVTLTFNEPLDPSNIGNFANYVFSGGSGITVSSAILTNGVNVILTVIGSLDLANVITVKNVRDVSVRHNVIVTTNLTLGMNLNIPMTATWKYNQDGGDAGTNWVNYGYSDTGWSNGAALLYVESSALPATKGTLLNLNGTNGAATITYYFRLHFTSPMRCTNATLLLQHIVDDGAVFYLNGAEFHRFNIPAGPVTYQTVAAPDTVDNGALRGPYTITLTNLLAGENVLAVEVHQVNNSSSDVCFGASLDISIPSGPIVQPPAPSCNTNQTLSITMLPGKIPQLSWSGKGFELQYATNLVGDLGTIATWTPLVTGSNDGLNTYNDTVATNKFRVYRLRCTQ